MNSKTGVVGEILRHINAKKINLIICSPKFKKKYSDAVAANETVKGLYWVEFDAKQGTMNVNNYDLLMRRTALLVNDMVDDDSKGAFNEAAFTAMGVYDTRIVDTLYCSDSK